MHTGCFSHVTFLHVTFPTFYYEKISRSLSSTGNPGKCSDYEKKKFGLILTLILTQSDQGHSIMPVRLRVIHF